MADGRSCSEYKCRQLYYKRRLAFVRDKSGNLNMQNLPPENIQGIYAIFERGVVIYVGLSTTDIRSRLITHLKGQGQLNVDKYLKEMSDIVLLRHIEISYVRVENPSCCEHQFLTCIQRKLGKWPEYNMRGGNSVCEDNE